MTDVKDIPAGHALDKAVAIEIMGWKLGKEGAGEYPAILRDVFFGDSLPIDVWLCPDPENRWIGVTSWRPSTRWAEAGMVVEEMQRRGYWLKLASPFAPGAVDQYGQPYGREWHAGFTPHGTTGWNGRPDHEESGPAAPEAISRAALAAVRAQREGR